MSLARRLALALLALLGCNSAPEIIQRDDVQASTGLALGSWEYLVGPGDLLRVNVFGHPELSAVPIGERLEGCPVEGNGTIQLPLIGAVPVDGLTTGQVAERVSQALERYLKEPRVDVAVLRHGAHRYLVLGEVAKPGAYSMARPTTPLEALAGAGGMATYANREQVAWVHGTLEAAHLRIFDASELDPLATQLVESGDVIFVGRRSWADASEAARDLIPVLQTFSIPLSLAIQAATLERID